MLVERLKVTLADLLPEKGVAVSLVGEASPYRISERLHAALKEVAEHRGAPISTVLHALREEIQASQ